MPLVLLDTLPDDARIWVFAATPALDAGAATRLLAEVDDHLVRWQAHGEPLTVARGWSDDRFLLVAVDQRTANASGCSIDGLFRTLREAEDRLGVSLVAGGRVFWRDAGGAVQGGARDAFVAAALAGGVTADTPVFDTTVGTLGAWRSGFTKRAADSWHGQLVPRTTNTSA